MKPLKKADCLVAVFIVVCFFMSACGGSSSFNNPLDKISSSATKEDVISLMGDEYEEVNGDMVYKNVDFAGYNGKLNIWWVYKFCVPQWVYIRGDESDEGFSEITNKIVTYFDKTYGKHEGSDYVWTVKGEKEITLRKDSKEISITVRPDDPYYDGLRKIANGNYEEGRNVLSDLGQFDSEGEDVLSAMYRYIISNPNKTRNNTYYQYISKLSKERYADTQEMYLSLYSWKVEVIGINNSEEDTIIKESKLNILSNPYFHIRLTGGAPGETFSGKCVFTFPAGSRYSPTEIVFKGEWENNSTGWFTCGKVDYATGTLKAEFFDSKGNLIGEDSVEIVKPDWMT